MFLSVLVIVEAIIVCLSYILTLKIVNVALFIQEVLFICAVDLNSAQTSSSQILRIVNINHIFLSFLRFFCFFFFLWVLQCFLLCFSQLLFVELLLLLVQIILPIKVIIIVAKLI